MMLTLGQIADWIHAEGDFDDEHEALGYSIDTRTLAAGDLYFAVRGELLDGHDFVEAAIRNGAVAAVVSQHWLAPAGFDECTLLRVPDDCDDCVLKAMQQLARKVRQRWGKRVIAITGSAGKTTTKECVAAVLGKRFRVLKTEGNLNNHFGVPLMLLRLTAEHDVAVIEMGMNHAGEIATLAKIAAPDWGVVSNVGMAHVEFFADGIEGVARAKRELIEALPADGVAFLNADDERVRSFAAHTSATSILFGTTEDADPCGEDIEELGLLGTNFVWTGQGVLPGVKVRCPVQLRLPGRHNVLNALAAFAVGCEAGVEAGDAVAAMEALRPTEKRGNSLEFHGATIVNDTYNSNPAALQAMIHALAGTAAERRILIAGEMRELGGESLALHAACGEAAARAGIDIVVGVAGWAEALVAAAKDAGGEAVFVASPQDAGAWMQENLRAGDVALLKASRGVALERALAMLR